MPPAAPPGATDGDRLALAIDRHVTKTSATFADVLATTLHSLDEPRATGAGLALHRLDYLVETLLGVAAGAVIGRVVSAVLRGFGSDVGLRLEQELREALRAIGPHSDAPLGALTPARPFVHDAAARPLVDELGARLYLRIGRAGRDHRAVLARLSGALPRARVGAFVATLDALDDDPLLASLWSEHLRVAWSAYRLAVGRDPTAALELPPALANSIAAITWHAWLARVRGEPISDRTAPPQGDYIMAVVN